LGKEAAYYVNHARYLIGSDSIPQPQLHRELSVLQNRIESTGQSNSCPGGANKQKDRPSDDIFDLTNISKDNQDESDDSKLEDCEFISKECPKCGAKDVKTECKSGVYYGECGCSSNGGKANSKVKDEQFTLAA
jgi:hypothetical protein